MCVRSCARACVPCAQLILKAKPKMTNMRFYANGAIDDAGAALLVKLRKDEPRLAHIVAIENKITMAGAQMVADAVTADKGLAFIDISEGLWEQKALALEREGNYEHPDVEARRALIQIFEKQA